MGQKCLDAYPLYFIATNYVCSICSGATYYTTPAKPEPWRKTPQI